MNIEDWGEEPVITICRRTEALPEHATEPGSVRQECELCRGRIWVAPSTRAGIPSHLVCDRCGLKILGQVDAASFEGFHPEVESS